MPAIRLPLVLLLCVAATSRALGGEPAPAIRDRLPTTTAVGALIDGGQAWLLTQQQPNGAFLPGTQFTLGITALAVHALCSPPHALPGRDPRIAKAIAHLRTYQQPDGGFYSPAEGLGGYGTSLTLMAFAAAGIDDPETVRGAQRYLFGIQNRDPASVCAGGIGHGPEGPGQEDLHNTATAIVALRTTGIPASDPRLQQALRFVESCQNLSHHQRAPGGIEEAPRLQRPWVNNDGGAVYSPTESKAGGDWNPRPKAGEPHYRLHSYGSMTHALIESYLALDVPADDERVRAALAWLCGNYGFDANPGMPDDTAGDGLFYFYAVAAKTYDLTAQGGLVLGDGRTAVWQADLFDALRRRARQVDGMSYWINPAPRWGEAIPHLVTAYSLQALKRLHRHL
jgi:squalene-hopene/tetraprenyl-beta-curcumene cyclase